MSLVAAVLTVSTVVADTGSLDVQLSDGNGQPREVAGVVVFLTHENGMPVRRPDSPKFDADRPSPFIYSLYLLSTETFVSEITDAVGRATFKELPPGKYRLIAQKWDGVDGHPQHPKGLSSIDRWRVIPNEVTAFGTATSEVVANETSVASIKPLGDSSLAITIKAEHRGNLLSVSLGKPLIEPELASSIINRHLDREVILTQHVSQTAGDIILRGLPSDEDITVALMAYDNSPGFGGITTKAGPGVRKSITVYAGWSDSEELSEPESLVRLIDFLEVDARKDPADQINPIVTLGFEPREKFIYPGRNQRINYGQLFEAASLIAEKQITIEGFGKTTAAEFVVALSFALKRQRDAVQRLKEEQSRPAESKPAPTTPPDDVTPPDDATK